MTRYSDLESIMAKSIEAVWIKETSHMILMKWFDDVKSIIDKHDIHPRNIYNMDETGLSIGCIKATREMDRYIRTGIPCLQKAEWLHAFVVAQAQAFNHRNIRSRWAGTGLNLFNPNKVFSRVPNLSPPTPSPQQPTLEYDCPLDNPELNSSPTDTHVLRSANTEIFERARDCQAIFDTPACSHVIRLVSTLNRSLARNRITEIQFSELEQIITTRKHQQLGKHTILHGETIIAAMRSQQTKKRKVRHPSTPAPQVIAPSVLGNPFSSDNNEDIMDCIV